MPIELRGPNDNIFVVAYAGHFSDEEYEGALAAMVHELEVARAAKGKIALVSIGSSDSSMTWRQRVRSAEWLREHGTLLRDACVGQAVVGGAIQRGVLRAILWMIDYPVPIRAFSDEDEARGWSRSNLAEESGATSHTSP